MKDDEKLIHSSAFLFWLNFSPFKTSSFFYPSIRMNVKES
ncbi:hypothetical protein US8_03990 [Bacillus altitudinis]|nr:hypothetical protein US8_03990 [Bacillus altitudinis]